MSPLSTKPLTFGGLENDRSDLSLVRCQNGFILRRSDSRNHLHLRQ